MSNIGQAWANLNDSDDENDDDDKTMIEARKSDASLAYMALLINVLPMVGPMDESTGIPSLLQRCENASKNRNVPPIIMQHYWRQDLLVILVKCF